MSEKRKPIRRGPVYFVRHDPEQMESSCYFPSPAAERLRSADRAKPEETEPKERGESPSRGIWPE